LPSSPVAGYEAVALGTMFVVSGAFLSKQAIESVMGPAILGLKHAV